MELNFLLFPAPKRNWTSEALLGFLIWVPVRHQSSNHNSIIPKDVQKRFQNFEGEKGGRITLKKKKIAGKITLKGNNTTTQTGNSTKVSSSGRGAMKNRGVRRIGVGQNRIKDKFNLKKYSLGNNENEVKNIKIEKDIYIKEYSRADKVRRGGGGKIRSMENPHEKMVNDTKQNYEIIESFSSINLDKKMMKFGGMELGRKSLMARKEEMEIIKHRKDEDMRQSGLYMEDSDAEGPGLNALMNMNNLEAMSVKRGRGMSQFSQNREFKKSSPLKRKSRNGLPRQPNMMKKKKGGISLGRKRVVGGSNGFNFHKIAKKNFEFCSPVRYMKNITTGDTMMNIPNSDELIEDEENMFAKYEKKSDKNFYQNPLSKMKKNIDSFSIECSMDPSSQLISNLSGFRQGGHHGISVRERGVINNQLMPVFEDNGSMEETPQKLPSDGSEVNFTEMLNSMAISDDPSVRELPIETTKRMIKKSVDWKMRKLTSTTFSKGKDYSNSYSTGHDVSRNIPCLYLPTKNPSRTMKDKILLHFHGNAEDIRGINSFLANISHSLQCNVLGVEYPGYGLYKGKSSEKQILDDSEAIIKYIIEEMGFKQENIVLSGRSMGSGPSIHLASIFKVKAIVLVSPFLSIRGVASNMIGKMGSLLLKERFNNEEKVGRIKCPMLIIHSRNDTLVPYAHSEKLKECARNICIIIDNVLESHRMTDVNKQYIQPVKNFLKLVNSAVFIK